MDGMKGTLHLSLAAPSSLGSIGAVPMMGTQYQHSTAASTAAAARVPQCMFDEIPVIVTLLKMPGDSATPEATADSLLQPAYQNRRSRAYFGELQACNGDTLGSFFVRLFTASSAYTQHIADTHATLNCSIKAASPEVLLSELLAAVASRSEWRRTVQVPHTLAQVPRHALESTSTEGEHACNK